MPETPIQIQILDEIQRRMEETVVQGETYFNSLNGIVFIGRTVFDDQDPLPLISILEVPIPEDQRAPSKHSGLGNLSGPWELIIQGWVRENEPQDRFRTKPAYCLKEDILCFLANERSVLQRPTGDRNIFGFRQIKDIQFDRGVVRPDDERSATSFFWIPLVIDLSN